MRTKLKRRWFLWGLYMRWATQTRGPLARSLADLARGVVRVRFEATDHATRVQELQKAARRLR